MIARDKIISNLEKYQLIKKYLRGIIEERLSTNDYHLGILTGSLLDNSVDNNRTDLESLNYILEMGEKHCIDFRKIFQISLPPDNPDSRIIDMLAEVRAFEFLFNTSFEDISYLPQKAVSATVDFTADKNRNHYAIEVTRLGLPQSEKKKPKYEEKNNLFSMIIGKDNYPKWEQTINDAIENEYKQVKRFCQAKRGTWNGVIFISRGRDYFVHKDTRGDMYLPKTLKVIVQDVFNNLKEANQYKYLQHLILAFGKQESQILTCPSFI
jgi:hypothetical protein